MVDGPETTLPDVDDIARHTLADLDTAPMHLSLEGHHEEVVNVDLRAAGHVAVGRLHITCKGQAVVHLHLSGDAGWCGLHLTGKVADGSHLSVVVTDELHLESRVVRCDDWRVGRDATFETGTLSVGGFEGSPTSATTSTRPEGTFASGWRSMARAPVMTTTTSRFTITSATPPRPLSPTSRAVDAAAASAPGRLVIDAGADGTDAGQVFRNLLESGVRVLTNP